MHLLSKSQTSSQAPVSLGCPPDDCMFSCRSSCDGSCAYTCSMYCFTSCFEDYCRGGPFSPVT